MKTRQWLGLLIVLLLGLALVWLAREPEQPRSQSLNSEAPSVLTRLLSDTGQTPQQRAHWAQARPDYRLQFPADHLAHNRFSIEWWYLTANLTAVDTGEHLGAQFTLFRRGLAVEGEQLSAQNPWQQPQLYMGHMALTDTAAGQHRSAQRLTRQGPGLAGTTAQPLAVWLENWQLQAEQSEQLFPARLSSWDAEEQFGYQLRLTAEKPLLLQGEQGYSAKHSTAGEGQPQGASHYYSYTRLTVSGTVRKGEQQIEVRGQAWYDHEWTSSTLVAGQQGWDWFALQLDDGRDLTAFRVRGEQGDHWQLALAGPEGERLAVDSKPRLTVLGHWRSDDGVQYPARWRLQLAQPALDIQIQPRLADQEMKHMVRYWEGAVTVSGSQSGQGYVELTGYDQGD